jgi:NAD(P)-dependent dehydrogenase (short-subunit alcohol dehydrogenase family)
MQRLSGQVALVTGAASGIGRATARRLADEGARVVATDLAGDGLTGLASPAIATLRHDVAAEDGWRAAIEAALARFGGVHVLVNAAGILAHGTIEDTSLADWRHMMEINLYGTFLGCRLAMPAIEASGGGAIVNISSIAGLMSTPDIFAYGASKGGVRTLTKAVALAGAQRRPVVRCNSVHPGVIATPMVANYFRDRADPAKTEEAWRKSQPGGTFGTPEDVAAVIAFLACGESAFVTGAELTVDGAATA